MYIYIYIYIYISSCEFVNSTDLGDVRYFFKLDDVTPIFLDVTLQTSSFRTKKAQHVKACL